MRMVAPAGGGAIRHSHRVSRLAAHERAVYCGVVTADQVVNTPDNGELVGVPRNGGQGFGHEDTWHIRRLPPIGSAHLGDCVRLWIERIALIRPADLKENYASS